MAQTTTMTSMDQPELARPDRARKLWLLILVLGWLLSVAWRLWLSRNLTSPTIRSDEDSYLLTARAFITGIGGETTENTLFRRTGFSLLISPAYALTSDPGEAYRIMQIINAMINALVLPLAYVAGRRIFRWDRRFSLLAAIAASTLPAVAFYSGIAMTEAVLAPIVLGWLIACHAMISKPRSAPTALLAGALAGLAYLMHVRGVVIAALHPLLLLFLLVRRPRLRLTAALLSAGALVGAVLFNEWVIRLLGDSMQVSGVSPGSTMAEKLATVRGVAKIVMSASGQIWYLAIAGFGITLIGMLAIPRWLRKGPNRDRATGITMVVALLATLGIALMSAAVLQGIAMRENYLAYPRYVHPLEPWWLLTGIAALAVAVRRKYLVPAFAVLFTGAIGVLVWYRMTRGSMRGFYTFDSPELSILTNGWTRLRPIVATVLGIVMIVLVVWLVTRARSRRRALLWLTGALVVINLVMVPVAVERVSVPMMDKTVGRPSLAELGVHPGDNVVVEGMTIWWQRRNTEREVTWARVRAFNLHDQAPPKDANVVVAFYKPGNEYDWDGTAYGFHRVGASADHWAVWRRNGT